MIAVLCTSPHLADYLASIAPGGSGQLMRLSCPSGDCSTVAQDLNRNSIKILFFEPSLLKDPATCRRLAPSTRLVVLYGPGEESLARSALTAGAAAVLEKPVSTDSVYGVYRLVCS